MVNWDSDSTDGWNELPGGIMDDKLITLPTGEVVRRDDVDTLIDVWERADKVNKATGNSKRIIAQLLGDRTPDSDSRTRRVEGERRRAVIEMPDDAYDNKTLIQIWHTTEPGVRERVLKIETVAIQKREFKKLVNAAVTPKLEHLMHQIAMAESGAAGNPRIKSVEQIAEAEVVQSKPQQPPQSETA